MRAYTLGVATPGQATGESAAAVRPSPYRRRRSATGKLQAWRKEWGRKWGAYSHQESQRLRAESEGRK